MDKIPAFPKFERWLMGIISGIKEAWKAKKRFALLIYFLFVAAGIFLLIGAFVQGLITLGILKDNISQPKSQLIYDFDGESKLIESGKYETSFKLKYFDPRGNLGKLYYTYPQGCPKDWEYVTGGTEFKEGILYAAQEYKVTCITDKPIIENGELFELKK